MKKLLSLAFIVLFASLAMAVAGYTDLVAFNPNDAQSHACKPGTLPCSYAYTVEIPNGFAYPNCDSGGTRVLGLSDIYNAHAEIGTQSNYDVNLCMVKNVFTSKICGYTQPGHSCVQDFNSDYSLFFGLSGATNAHISSGNVFPNEIQFCCDFPTSLQCRINLNTDKQNYRFGNDVNFTYNCPSAGSAIDINLVVSAPGFSNSFDSSTGAMPKCGQGSGSSFVINSATNLINQTSAGTIHYLATIGIPYSACTASTNFSVTKGLIEVPIPPLPTCDITSLFAKNMIFDSNVSISYACSKTVTDANLLIFAPTSEANKIFESDGITCDTGTSTFSDFVIPSGSDSYPEGVYTARLADENCTKDFFFVVAKPNNEQPIPDTNVVVVAALLGVVLLVLRRKK